MSPYRAVTIPGLGFTPELFARLQLRYPTEHLAWIEPRSKEPLAEYAYRLARPVREATSRPILLIGHSFGGIVAQEIAAQIPVAKLILVSSVKSRREIPFALRAVAPLRLHGLFGRGVTLRTFGLWGRFFGYRSKEVQDLFRRMVGSHSTQSLRWALHALSAWRGADCGDTEIHQLHGDADRTLPVSRIARPFVPIAGGTHMMVFDRATEVRTHIHRLA